MRSSTMASYISRAIFSSLLVVCFAPLGWSQSPEKRIALVIGNAAYSSGALATTANDAGLIAQTLQAAGFDVVGARDLDGDALRHALHDFVDKAAAAGPGVVSMIYLSGYGLQLTGENYFVPIDAKMERDVDVPVTGVRISDYLRQLNGLLLKANILVLDAARANPFAKLGQPLAGGLALVDAEPNTLVAFNAAPGTIAPDEHGPYGAYAQALAESIREGGLPLPEVFGRVRLRVNQATKGDEIPWDSQKITQPFVFFERSANAPPVVDPQQTSSLRSRPLRELGASDAFIAALDRDTLQGYEDFLTAYPGDPLSKRVQAILAARREALTWRRTYRIDTPDAYWSYLRRYPSGPHAFDARRRLSMLAAALEPPPAFAMLAYDVPPPPPVEILYVNRPVLVFNDPRFGFVLPPPPPISLIPAPPVGFVILPPPPPPTVAFLLPVPLFVAFPAYVSPPTYVAPPPNNIIFSNIHNTTVINNVINQPAAAPAALAALGSTPVVAGGGAAASLPPFVAQRASLTSGAPGPAGSAQFASPSQATPAGATPAALLARPGPGQALPGANGQALPPVPGRPAALSGPVNPSGSALSAVPANRSAASPANPAAAPANIAAPKPNGPGTSQPLAPRGPAAQPLTSSSALAKPNAPAAAVASPSAARPQTTPKPSVPAGAGGPSALASPSSGAKPSAPAVQIQKPSAPSSTAALPPRPAPVVKPAAPTPPRIPQVQQPPKPPAPPVQKAQAPPPPRPAAPPKPASPRSSCKPGSMACR